eukprot:1758569-Amphidinium_carterae.1
MFEKRSGREGAVLRPRDGSTCPGPPVHWPGPFSTGPRALSTGPCPTGPGPPIDLPKGMPHGPTGPGPPA